MDSPKMMAADCREDPSPEHIAEEKALVRKVDLLLMPTIWFTYLFSYADRTNIGNAKVAGMTDDLHMSSNDYSLSLVIFFISYIIFEVPSNLLLSKTKPSLYIPAIMILWGVVTCCMAAVQGLSGLLAIRFMLGVLEAGFAPGVMLMMSCWYKKSEQSRRFSIFYSAAVLSGAFGGVVAGAISGTLDGARGIAGWRWLFIVEGAATIACAIIAAFILPDFPATTKRLSVRERELALERLKVDNVTGLSEDCPPLSAMDAIRLSITDWRTWLLTLGYMCVGGSSTMSYFYPTLVRGLGYTAEMAQYMTAPIYAVAFVCVLVTGYFSDKYHRQRGLIIAGWLGVSTVCSVIVCAVYGYTARYALLVFVASGLKTGNAMSLAFASSTFAPMRQETRAVSLAVVNSLANLSGVYGAYLFPGEDKPKYTKGFAVVSALCAMCVAVYVTAHVLLRRYPARGAGRVD